MAGWIQCLRQDTMDSDIPLERVHDDLSDPFCYGIREADVEDFHMRGIVLVRMGRR